VRVAEIIRGGQEARGENSASSPARHPRSPTANTLDHFLCGGSYHKMGTLLSRAETLTSEQLSSYCLSESLTEVGLRILFEWHEVTSELWPEKVVQEVFLRLCYNGKITEGIIRCFLEYLPGAALFNEDGITPLHAALFGNSNRVSVNIVQLLVDAAPTAVGIVDSGGRGIFHQLCCMNLDESTAVEILKFLIVKCPGGVRHIDKDGHLPLHMGILNRSHEFCRVLVEAYPGSEKIRDVYNQRLLPLILTCSKGKYDLATVEYLYNLYPDAIQEPLTVEVDGWPICYIISYMYSRNDPKAALEIVQLLLNRNPDLAEQRFEVEGEELSLLFWACEFQHTHQNSEACIQLIKVIFDACPAALIDFPAPDGFENWNEQISTFFSEELLYYAGADDEQFPLHTALQTNGCLGRIKLLCENIPQARDAQDSSGSFPLHVACQHHDSTDVIEFLLEEGLGTSALYDVDFKNNTALHYACRGAKYETIAMLIEKYNAVSISNQNADGKLPLDLLLGSNDVSDRESIEYTESVFRLLRADPETVAQAQTLNCVLFK
jgi:ankyrin repeat protein